MKMFNAVHKKKSVTVYSSEKTFEQKAYVIFLIVIMMQQIQEY